mmetsp:Transcript_16757/g.29349  ORF Transcript_16757/g.29349 Transcript_16757/m.29349 type:complete len:400 (+) Transcript_16757:725-1924(+)
MENVESNVVWQSFVATFYSCLASVLCVVFVPITRRWSDRVNQVVSSVLMAFSAGAMLGDVFLHLIPHALHLDHAHHHGTHDIDHHDHNDNDNHQHEHLEDIIQHKHEHEAQRKGSIPQDLILALIPLSIIAFFALELAISRLFGKHDHHHHHHRDATDNYKKTDGDIHPHTNVHPAREGKSSINRKDASSNPPLIGSSSQSPSQSPPQSASQSHLTTLLRSAAHLNLISDFIHNFTDGIILSAVYLSTPSSSHIGHTTLLAILSHEIPQEIGDITLLLSSGYSLTYTLLLNFAVSLSALLGNLCGVVLIRGMRQLVVAEHEIGYVEECCVAITAGGMLYSTLSGIVPVFREMCFDRGEGESDGHGERKESKYGMASDVVVGLVHVCALVMGLGVIRLAH